MLGSDGMIPFLTEKFTCLLQSGGNTEVSGNDWSSLSNMLGQFFLLILVLAFVIFLAYYSTKLMGRGIKGMRKGSNLETIESIGIGIGSTIQLLRAGSKYFLIGVSKDRITYLTEVDENSIDFSGSSAFKPFSIDEYFKKITRRSKNGGGEDEK